jgi:hypothetical protein
MVFAAPTAAWRMARDAFDDLAGSAAQGHQTGAKKSAFFAS